MGIAEARERLEQERDASLQAANDSILSTYRQDIAAAHAWAFSLAIEILDESENNRPVPGYEWWYLADCDDCVPRAPVPFRGKRQRNEWAQQHRAATGHQIALMDEARPVG